MSVGDSSKIATRSYVAYARESTFGTYASATTAVEAISCGFIVEQASRKIEAIGPSRAFATRVPLEKTVSGPLETNLHPLQSVLLVANALGGGIASSVTAVAGTYTHSITAGNFDTIAASVSFNVRKGETHVFRYLGGRVNELKIAAEIGEPVMASFEMIFKDATTLSDDIATILSISAILPFTFVNGVYRYAATESVVNTTTAQEPIQAFELVISNNIATGPESRQLGTNLQTVLAPTKRNVELTITQRFDTTTVFDRMLQSTQGAVELYFAGATITASSAVDALYECTIRFPKVFYNAADPTLDGPNEVLTVEIPLDVVTDNPNTTTGKDIGITFKNQIASY